MSFRVFFTEAGAEIKNVLRSVFGLDYTAKTKTFF